MPLNKNVNRPTKKKPAFSVESIKGPNSERSAIRPEPISRGLIHLKSQNKLSSPPEFEDNLNWPSINFSSKSSKAKSAKKDHLLNPSQSNFSFKSALCGDAALVTTEFKPIQINATGGDTVRKQERKVVVDSIEKDEWINVSNRRKTKNKPLEEPEKSIDLSVINVDKAKKREQHKLKKRMIREQKTQEEKEFKRKDTRINIASQDFIDSIHQNSSSNNSRINVPKHVSFQASHNSGSMDQQNSLFNHITFSTRKNKEKTVNKKKTPNVGPQIIAKRKVKTKDLINLSIVDLIKKKDKRPIVSTPIVKREKILLKKKPGKQNDTKRNSKKSKLRKTIIKQSKIGRENFALYLAEIFQENLKVSEESVPNTVTLEEDAATVPLHESNLLTNVNANVPLPEEGQTVQSRQSKITDPAKETSVISVEQKTPSLPLLSAEEKDVTHNLLIEETDEYSSLKTFQMDLIKEINFLCNPLHSRKFREYCTHFITPNVNELLTEFLELIVKFQVRLYENDPLKGKTKRRFYCGLKESWKHVKKLTCVVIAPDIKCNAGAGGLDELLQNILAKVECSNTTTVIFGLNQRQLGRLSRRKCNVSCIGITNFQGAQDVHKQLMEAVNLQKEKYQNARDALIGENIRKKEENIPG